MCFCWVYFTYQVFLAHIVWYYSEWGGAESRGSRARPVELMIMGDTCTTHRSRVPRRSSGRIKGGATTVQDERGPGLDFNLCFVCGSRPWGAAALLLCLFMLLKSSECSPVPASFFPIYELCYRYTEEFMELILKEGKKTFTFYAVADIHMAKKIKFW